MAEHQGADVAQGDADFAEHLRTYHLFLNLFKFGLLGVICVLILLAVVTL
jgi:hypothetical protein